MKNKIVLKDISLSFDDLVVFDSFSAEISENSAIMGASGRGKTSLVRLIAGLTNPCGGEIIFENKPKISAVFQEDRLFDSFSAIENVTCVLGGGLSKNEAQMKAESLLSELLIEPSEQKKAVRDYSGGMRRRVAIARALAAESDVLILDEPYKGLDEKTRAVVAECIKKYSQDKLVILVTHDKTEAEITGIENIILI